MKILFVGSDSNFNQQLAATASRMGHDIRFEPERAVYLLGGIFKRNFFAWRITQRLWRLKAANKKQFNEYLILVARKWSPDIFLTTRGYSLEEKTIQKMREVGIKTVHWSAENVYHPQWHDWFYRTVSWYNIVFTFDSGVLEKVKNEQPNVDIRYLPHAFDPAPYQAPISDTDRSRFACDVAFAGVVFGERIPLLQSIIDAGFNVKIFSWPDAKLTSLGKYCHGPLSAVEMGKLYRVAKICLNNNLEPKGNGVDWRTLEICMAGGFQLTDEQTDLSKIFEVGKEVAIYKTREEALDKVRYYLNHESEREVIAKAGHDRALRDHTLDTRLKQLFGQL